MCAARYHFHERLTCLYDKSAAGHSTKVGEGVDDAKTPIYGKFESTNELPTLDACGAHFGSTPDSNGASVYHHHLQHKPPFTIGCFGPSASGGPVSLAECRALYSGSNGCGGDDVTTVTTPQGSVQYDLWCPCYDATGSNVAGGGGGSSGGSDSSSSSSGGGDSGGATPEYAVSFALQANGNIAEYTNSKVAQSTPAARHAHPQTSSKLCPPRDGARDCFTEGAPTPPIDSHMARLAVTGDIAIAAGVMASDVALTVRAGSVVIAVVITVASADTAAVVTSTIAPHLQSAMAATAMFTSTVVSVAEVSAQPTTATPPTKSPPPPPPPLSPPPGLATTTLIAIVAGGGGGALLLAIVIAVYCCRSSRSGSAMKSQA